VFALTGELNHSKYARLSILMNRQFIPFDDSYRVPADVRVSRGVGTGERLFICGQMDLDAEGQARNLGSLRAQSIAAMHLLYDVIERSGFEPEDIVHLHVFYRSPTDETRYLRELLDTFPQCKTALTVLTPVVSYPSAGAEVEIDAIAIKHANQRVVTNSGNRVVGHRKGDWIVAQTTPQTSGSLSSQIKATHTDLRSTLGELGAGLEDVCKVHAYFSPDIDSQALAKAECELARDFAEAAPTYHGVVLPAPFPDGENLRVEVIALDSSLPRKRVTTPWQWPPPICYSQGIRCGDTVFVGAQFAVSNEAKLSPNSDLAAQTHHSMTNMKAVLNALGMDFDHMTKVNAYFIAEQDLAQWTTNVSIRSSYYVKPGPASTGIENLALSVPGALISVDCIAVDS